MYRINRKGRGGVLSTDYADDTNVRNRRLRF
jgi:hypothetical protein